jgi:hypothetical protein
MGEVLSGISFSRQSIFRPAHRSAWFKRRGESLAGARDSRADRADRDVQRRGGLFVGELSPCHQQKRIAVCDRQASKRTGKLRSQRAVGMLDLVLTVVSESFQCRQAASFDPAVIGDHVVRNTKKPRQRAVVRQSTALTITKAANEDLRREVLDCRHPDPPGDVPVHGGAVTLIQTGERMGLRERAVRQLSIIDWLLHDLYVADPPRKVRAPLKPTLVISASSSLPQSHTRSHQRLSCLGQLPTKVAAPARSASTPV